MRSAIRVQPEVENEIDADCYILRGGRSYADFTSWISNRQRRLQEAAAAVLAL